jgi:hypothetical protein
MSTHRNAKPSRKRTTRDQRKELRTKVDFAHELLAHHLAAQDRLIDEALFGMRLAAWVGAPVAVAETAAHVLR